MKFVKITTFILMSGASAFAQIDASSLWAKYGPPLQRETFAVRPGIEMVVDYGPAKQACRIQLPSGMNIVGTVLAGAITREQIDQILNEVIPAPIRGKEVNRGMIATGAPMLFTTMYENVTISELKVGGEGKGITVIFKDPACPKRIGP